MIMIKLNHDFFFKYYGLFLMFVDCNKMSSTLPRYVTIFDTHCERPDVNENIDWPLCNPGM